MSSLRLSAGVASYPDPSGPDTSGSASSGPASSSLERILESLLTQDRPFNQIVVTCTEDQSEETSALLKRLEDRVQDRLQDRSVPIIQAIPIPSGLSPTQQWNLLAPHLTGDWISFFTPEDLARPNFAREVEQTVSATPSAVILRAGWLSIRDNGRPGETYTLHSVRSVVKPPEALYDQRFGPKGSFSAAAIRCDIWQKAGLFPSATPILGDWAMWFLAGALGDTVRSREVIVEHRSRQQSTADDAFRKTSEIREAYHIYREILPRATSLAGLHPPNRNAPTGKIPTWIAAASRKRFRDVAIAASNRFSADLRGPFVEALRPWAASVDQQQLLGKLERGERIRDFNLARRVKPALKRIISAVR